MIGAPSRSAGERHEFRKRQRGRRSRRKSSRPLPRANDGAALAYGRDDWTRRVERRFAEIFEREVAVFLVPTGTAANALALAHLTPPWGAVLCHDEAHIATDECGAPEFFGGGIKLIGLAGRGRQDRAGDAAARARCTGNGAARIMSARRCCRSRRRPKPARSIAPDEIRQLADIAHAHGLAVHVDGARFANALARMNASPGAKRPGGPGVDVLSFGATKGGALAAEAVVFFDRGPRRRHVGASQARRPSDLQASLHRRADSRPIFADDLLAQARAPRQRHGRPAGRAGLPPPGFVPVWPVEANEVFVALPARIDERLKAAGASYYPWTTRCAAGRPSCRRAMTIAGAPGDVVCHDCGRGRSVCGGGACLLMPRAAPKLRPIPGYRCDMRASRDRSR